MLLLLVVVLRSLVAAGCTMEPMRQSDCWLMSAWFVVGAWPVFVCEFLAVGSCTVTTEILLFYGASRLFELTNLEKSLAWLFS